MDTNTSIANNPDGTQKINVLYAWVLYNNSSSDLTCSTSQSAHLDKNVKEDIPGADAPWSAFFTPVGVTKTFYNASFTAQVRPGKAFAWKIRYKTKDGEQWPVV